LAIDEVLSAASVLEELPHTGKAKQFLRAEHGMGWPRLFLGFLVQIHFSICLGGREELGALSGVWRLLGRVAA
jgi:hypothetical protein